MEKTMTLNLRVNPTVKQQAEDVLKQLGIPMATAIDMYLRQITLTGGIPFSLSLPKAPAALNADTMTVKWVLTGMDLTPSEFAALLVRAMPEDLKKLFRNLQLLS